MNKMKAIARVVLLRKNQYPAEVFYWLILSLIPLFLMTYLWLTVYKVQDAVNGYSQGRMVTYFFLVFLITRLSANPSFWLSGLIQQGELSSLLIRPMSTMMYKFVTILSTRVVNIIISAPILLIVIFILRDYILLPSSLLSLLLFVVAVVSAMVFSAIFGFMLGALSFWMTEVGSVHYIYGLILSFVGGGSLPLEFFPDALRNVLELLPFRFLYAFPAGIYIGSYNATQLLWGFIQMSVWLVVLVLMYRVLWRKGLQVYEAYGG